MVRMDELERYIGLGVWYIIAVGGLIANGYAIFLQIKSKSKKVSDRLVMHLCFSEMLIMAWHLVTRSLVWFAKIAQASTVRKIGGQLTTSLLFQTVICISLDRLLAASLVFRYKIFVTKRRLMIVLIIIWIFAITSSILCVFMSYNTTRIWLFWSGLTMVSIIATYSYIFSVLFAARRTFQNDSSQANRRVFNYQVPLAIAIIFILTNFIPCLVILVNEKLFNIWVLVTLYSNGIFDPLVYVYFHAYKKRHAQSQRERSYTVSNTTIATIAEEQV